MPGSTAIWKTASGKTNKMKHEISWPGSSVFQLLPLQNCDWLGTLILTEILCFLVLKCKFHCNSVKQNAPALLFFNVILNADSGRTQTDSKRSQWSWLLNRFVSLSIWTAVLFFSCSVSYHFAENTSTHKEEKNKSSYGIFSVECITVSACGYDLMFYSEVMLLLAKSHQHTFIAVLLSVFWLRY